MEEGGVASCWGKIARPYLVFLSAINIYAWYLKIAPKVTKQAITLLKLSSKLWSNPSSYAHIYAEDSLSCTMIMLEAATLFHIVNWILKIHNGFYQEQRPRFRLVHYCYYFFNLIFALTFLRFAGELGQGYRSSSSSSKEFKFDLRKDSNDWDHKPGNIWIILYFYVRCIEAGSGWLVYFFKLLHRKFVNLIYVRSIFMLMVLAFQFLLSSIIIVAIFSELKETKIQLFSAAADFSVNGSLLGIFYIFLSFFGMQLDEVQHLLVFLKRFTQVISQKEQIENFKQD